MSNANKKGKRGERMACKLLESFGYSARRSQQYSGVRSDSTSADILTSIESIRFEVKFGYNAELWHKQMQDWIETAKAETPKGKHWAILYKKTGARNWTLIFEIEGMIVQTIDVEQAIKFINNVS